MSISKEVWCAVFSHLTLRLCLVKIINVIIICWQILSVVSSTTLLLLIFRGLSIWCWQFTASIVTQKRGCWRNSTPAREWRCAYFKVFIPLPANPIRKLANQYLRNRTTPLVVTQIGITSEQINVTRTLIDEWLIKLLMINECRLWIMFQSKSYRNLKDYFNETIRFCPLWMTITMSAR